MAATALLALSALSPAARSAADEDKEDGPVFSSPCAAGRATDAQGNPCPTARPRLAEVRDAKVVAANAYHRFITGQGTREELERAEYTLSRLSGETIGRHDWSMPEHTPAALRLRGETPAHDYGPLQKQFWPFEQIVWWYCGPATAQSILWFLGPHRSESYDDLWQGRPVLTGDSQEDQYLLASDFWLATNKHEGTNWGERYMPFTLNAWRGSFWYIQSSSVYQGGDMTKEQTLIRMRYDFDHSYPVAENVLYAPNTYYPFGFWPGIVYQHWDVAYGYQEDADGNPYIQIGQVYHDARFPYQRFQQVAWDYHWGAIANWFGIVW